MQNPWKAPDASRQRQRHQIIHKAKDGKGSLPVVAFHETSSKVHMKYTQEKKGQWEELGGMVGLLDCFVPVPTVCQLPIIDREVKG